MAGNKPFDEEAALRLLKERGYSVKKPSEYKKRTFEVDVAVYVQFRSLQESLGLKIKEAFNLALIDWVNKHRDKSDGKK